MFVSSLLADLSPLPILIGGGVVFVVVAGVFLTLAVGLFGWIKRRRNRRQQPASEDETTDFSDVN
ncbi:MAG TPA: hypothetical protein EYG03_16650 [Planctomycetes bacterium]|nr:hypothetical protein [Planctomycetota bacterium]